MLVVLVNGVAGHRRRAPPVDAIRQTAPDAEVIVTRTLDELEQAAVELAERGVDDIAVWGGDGTVTAVLAALVRTHDTLPRLCLLPAGTMNANARGLGLRRAPLLHLRALVAGLDAGEVPEVERTVVRSAQRAGFLFGVGLIPNFLAVYEGVGQGGLGPAFSALGESAKSLFTGAREDRFFRGFEAKIFADDEPLAEGRFTNISAGGTEYLPLGFKAYHRAAERPGAFQLVAHAHSARSAALELWGIRRGRGMKHAEQGLFEHVRIELETPEPVSFDGDTFESKKVIELVGGTTVRLAVPG